MKSTGIFFAIIFLSVCASAQKSPLVIYLAGDSTMARKQPDKRPETGWGEMLEQNFDAAKVKIDDRALNGRSTKSFIAEGHWKEITDALKKGDYVFIEFGHNDEKLDKPGIGAAANGEYRDNLIKFVTEVRAVKAFPVLLTPVARRKFDAQGNLVDTHGEYPDAVRKVAAELKVPLIDMERKSEAVLKSYGDENSRKLFLQLKEGENPNYPQGVEDNTHFNPHGANVMAALAVEGIREDKLPLRKYLLKDTFFRNNQDFHSRLLPAPVNGGFKMDGYWVWCGSAIKGDDGKYHLFASRWSKSLSFSPHWLTNSEIVHAVSDTPQGPYKFVDVALPPRGDEFWDGKMTHNPAIRKYGDEYLLYYTGTTYKGAMPTADNQATETSAVKTEAQQHERIGLATSKSPYGPWKRLDKPILDTVPNSWEQYLVSNAAPLVLKNGKVMLYYKGVEKLRSNAVGLAIADCPTCEYKRVSDKPLNMGLGAEDPFIWQEDGEFRALMLDTDKRYSNKEIFYATSKDGLKWHISYNPLAISKNVLWSDGVIRKMSNTERPHVLLENGKPTYVFFATGETNNGEKYTWNMTIPLKKQ